MRRTDNGRESEVCQAGAKIFSDENVRLLTSANEQKVTKKSTDSL